MLLSMMLALAAPQDIAAANAADLRCMAIMSEAAGTAPEADRAGLIGGVMFFYGRIAGRSPGFGVETEMLNLLKADPEGTSLHADRPRCAQEMQDRGAYLITMGEHITALAKGE